MKTITVNVTQNDIENGIMGDSCNCPIALAVKRLNLAQRTVEVGRGSIEFDGMGRAQLPLRAQVFIVEFDNRGPDAVNPITFEISAE